MKWWAAVAVVAAAVGLVTPIAGATSAAELAPAFTVASITPTVITPGTTTDIVIAGTDFVATTTFSATPAGLTINNVSIDSAIQVTINVTAPGTPTTFSLMATPPGQAATFVGFILVRAGEGTFFPVTPIRASDTRVGIGGRSTPLGPKESYNVTVTGIGGASGVPTTNVAGVVLNVTATDTTSVSFVTVYPAGGQFPTVSNLNFGPNQVIPNHVTVGVGVAGQITIYNDAGTVNIIVDVVGYFVTAAGPIGAGYLAVSAGRFDSRSGAPLAPNTTVNITFNSIRPYNAVVFNLTIDQPTANGFITTYPTGQPRPNTSSVNFVAGQPVPNLVTSMLGTGNSVSFYNGSSGTVHLIIDWVGAYTTSPNFVSFVIRPTPGGPFRLWDSRITAPNRPLAAQEVYTVPGAVIPAGTVAVVANATVTGPTVGGFATVYTGGATLPPSSSLNFAAGETRANQVIPTLPLATRNISVYNDAGNANFIIDIFALMTLT